MQAYSYGTSRIIRTTVAAGVIVLALAALLAAYKISAWIQYQRRLRRQRDIDDQIDKERRATAYEIAAWADSPGHAPIDWGGEVASSWFNPWTWRGGRGRVRGRGTEQVGPQASATGKRGRIVHRTEMKNAFEVDEWEGFAVTE